MPTGRSRSDTQLRTGVFVGRTRSLSRLRRYLQREERIISVTGPAGIGKSRLVAQLLVTQPQEIAHAGTWVVCDLAEAATPEDIARRLANRLQLEVATPIVDDTTDVIGEILATQGPLLLVLDDADRALRPLRALIQRWFLVAPSLRFLVTARDTLDADGEKNIRVGPLRFPPPGETDAASIFRTEAAQLFVERARQSHKGFSLGAEDAPAVAEISRRLGGVPLALELAAARAGTYSPQELLERLPSRVQWLHHDLLETSGPNRRSGGITSYADEEEGLQHTIDWTWRLLRPWEQTALAHSSVFRGGFTLEAAQHVIDLHAHPAAPSVKEVLSRLAEKALIRSGEAHDAGGREQRYSHAASVRDFSKLQLDASGELQRLQHRHARYFLGLGKLLASGVDGHGGLALRRRLERETENLLGVVQVYLAQNPLRLSEFAAAAEIVLALEPVLTTRGPSSLHQSLLDRVLQPATTLGIAPSLHARVLESRARLRRAHGQMELSLQDLERAVAITTSSRDPLLDGRLRANLGTHHMLVGSYEKADAYYDEALEQFRSLGAKDVEARARFFRGQLRLRQGRRAEAIQEFEIALESLRQVGDRRYEGITLGEIANLYIELGNLQHAVPILERALQIHAEIGNRRFEGLCLRELGSLTAELARYDQASPLLQRAVGSLREALDRPGEAWAQTRLGDICFLLGQFSQARAHYDRAETLRANGGPAIRLSLLNHRRAMVALALGAANQCVLPLRQAHQQAGLVDEPAFLGLTERIYATMRGHIPAKSSLPVFSPDKPISSSPPHRPRTADDATSSWQVDLRVVHQLLDKLRAHLTKVGGV